MLQFNKKKIALYALILALCSTNLYGCNKDDAPENAQQEENAENPEDTNSAPENTPSDDGEENPDSQNEDGNQPAPDASGAEAPQKAIAEKSPVEITRIEVDDPDPYANGAGELPDDKDPHEHEVTPNLFEMDECQVEIYGVYQVKLAKDLLKEINSRRKDYGIGPLVQNTSLLACADSRCKEQTYFVGHFRPDGSAFNSIAPDYVQGECIAVEYRTVKEIMEAWFSVNKSRMQIMNPDYTQCGISIYDIEGTYYIAAEFGY